MGHNVFVSLIMTTRNVFLGRFMMERSVFIIRILVLWVQDGMEKSVNPLTIALLDFMEKIMFVSLSLRDVSLQQFGAMINAKSMVITVPLELTLIQVHATLKLPAKMGNSGTLNYSNASVLKVLAGTVSNVFNVLAIRFGSLSKVVNVLLAISMWVQNARSLIKIVVETFQMLSGHRLKDIVSVSLGLLYKGTSAFVREFLLIISVIDVLINLILNGNLAYVNVKQDMLNIEANAFLT